MIGLKDKKQKEIGFWGAIIEALSEKRYTKKFIIASVLFVLIYAFLYGFWKIPIINFGFNRMSAVGLTDILFILTISPLSGLLITLYLYERAILFGSSLGMGGVSGGVAGFVSAVCPVCQGIVLVAFGSTLLSIPTLALLPYLGLLKLFSLGLLSFAVILKADSIKNKKCPTLDLEKLLPSKKKKKSALKHENLYLSALGILVLLLFVNQLLIPKAFTSFIGGSISLGNLEYGPKITLKPMPLAIGEQPLISGYKTRVKALPTISELIIKPSTGDVAQDLVNNVIPTGVPWYGAEAGVSFDDPLTAQQLWGRAQSIELSTDDNERWGRIVNSFTCDYCCGSPQQPTIITQCGCAHAAAARGMSKWFIKNYGSKFSDEEIYGEMARWYALWYPKGTIERIIQESSVGG